jgi:ABC-type multidrug transport system permease subunit
LVVVVRPVLRLVLLVPHWHWGWLVWLRAVHFVQQLFLIALFHVSRAEVSFMLMWLVLEWTMTLCSVF